VGRSLDVGSYVRLGRGEEQSGGRDKDSILADTVEGLIGAVYVEGGMPAAADLVTRLFSGLLDDIATRRESLDYKTSLQELTAAGQVGLPRYEIAEAGPDHQKRFTATVTVGGEVLGRGEGRSKKEAEQRAAAEAFAQLRRRAVTSAPDPTSSP
jgi:ribonuclease-3